MGYRPYCFMFYGYEIDLSELEKVYPELLTIYDSQDYYDIIYNIAINAGLDWDEYIIDPDWNPDFLSFGKSLYSSNKDELIKILQDENIKNFYHDVYVKIMKKEPECPIDIGYVCYMG